MKPSSLPPITSPCARVCRHVHTSASNVEDACSFAWLQLLRCQPRRATVLEWLSTVAIREAWRLARGERRRLPLEAAGEPSTPSTTLTHEQAREALEVVASLPPRQRELVGLHAAGFTYDEIAALTGTSHRAVDRHLRRARSLLRHGGASGGEQ
jgi:RNA polymerase sigma factor (sigma-70 family)